MTVPGPGSRRSPAARLSLAGLLLLPLAELAVAIAVGRVIGAGPTILILLALSVLGMVVLRRAGARAMRSWSRADRQGTGGPIGDPWRSGRPEAVDVAWMVLGGVLLAIPGFITAAAGLLLAVGPTRRILRPLLERGTGRLAARLLRGPLVGRMAGARVVSGDVVEATVVDVEVVPPGERSPHEQSPQRPPRQLPPPDEPQDPSSGPTSSS
ncbi:MAG TPA: FxsA family protein [Kineosporiaceae bacterium]|nr:FxsA family protein [Kineosporiaceae bacterium]